MFVFQGFMSRLVGKKTLNIFSRLQKEGRYFATLKSAIVGDSSVALDTHFLASPRYEGHRSLIKWSVHLTPKPIFILNLTP